MHTHINDTGISNQGFTFDENHRSILAVILVSSRYDNQFLSLSYAVNVAVSVKLTLANWDESKRLNFFCVQIKKKKKDWPTDPLYFQAKRANKPFIFKAW